jgi:Fic family protein
MSGDYSYILKIEADKWGKNEVIAFSELYEKYIQKYQKKDLESKISIYKNIIKLQCAYIESGEEYFLTQIEIKKAQLPKKNEVKTESNTTQTLVTLSKFMGYRLSPKEITVDEFYTIIQDYERANKKK